MAETSRDITLRVRTTRDEGPTRSTERVDELGDHATKTGARLKLMAKAADGASRSLLKLAGSASAAKVALAGMGNETKKLERVMYKVHHMMRALGAALQAMLVKGLKFATISIGAMSVALVGVHALFITGRFLVKSYHVALKGLAATAAGAAVAIGLISAAIRENQAAMFAYRGQGHGEFGTGARQAQVALRGLQADTKLAGAGAEALSKVYGEIAKSKTGYNGASKAILRGLTDFAAAGQPVEEGLQKAAALVVALQDKKKGFGAVTAAAKELGPAMEKAMEEAKKKGIDTKEEFLKAIQDGTLAQLGGVTGQFDAVNNTLIGQLKKYFNLIRVKFADFGNQFLPEAKVGFEKIYRIFTRTMSATTASVTGWEKRGGFVDALVNATQKVSDFYLKLIRDYLPASEGMFRRLGAWWNNFKKGWGDVIEALRPLIDGARVVEATFGKAWRPVWNEIKARTNEFNRDIQRNKPALLEFGTAVGDATVKLLQLLTVFEKVLIRNLPFISRVVKAIGLMVEEFTKMFNMISGIFGNRNAFMMFMAIARGLKTTRGTLVDRELVTKLMNVRANNVNLVGAIKGGISGARAGMAIGGPKGAIVGGAAGAAAGSGVLGPAAAEALAKGGPAGLIARMLGRGAKGGAAPATGVESLGLASGRAAASVDSMVTPTAKATTGLGHFSRALGHATGRLLSGRPPSGRSSPTPALASGRASGVGAPYRVRPGKGHPHASPGKFSMFSRGMAAMGGYGYFAQRKADADAGGYRKPFGGMGALGTSILFSTMSDKIDNQEIASGMALAGTVSMFSPKMGIGVAGGTLALKSGDPLAAGLGGAVAGATIGSEFGAAGAFIGGTIGLIAGAIKSSSTALAIVAKQAQGIVTQSFARMQATFMVNMALAEAAARETFNPATGKRGGDTTIDDSLRNQAARMRGMQKTAKGGQRDVGNKGNFTQAFLVGMGAFALGSLTVGGVMGATGIGAIPGAVAATLGVILSPVVGLIAGTVSMFKGHLAKEQNMKDRAVRGKAIADLYASGAISEAEYLKLTTTKKKRRFRRDEAVDDDLQQQFLIDLEKKAKAYAEAFADTELMIKGKVDAIESMTGMAETDIIALAQRMNVNLADASADFTEQLRRLGLLMVKTAQQIDQAVSQILAETLDSHYDALIKQEQAPHILNDIIKNFMEDFKGRADKTVTAEDSKNIFGAYTEQLSNYYGGDTTRAFFEMQRQIGTADSIAFTTPGHPLFGMGQKFHSGEVGQRNRGFIQTAGNRIFDETLAPQIGAILGNQGQAFASADQLEIIRTQFGRMSVDDQERFTNILSSGNLSQFGGSMDALLREFGMGAAGGSYKELSALEADFAMAKDNLAKEGVLLDAQLKVTQDMAKFFGEDADKPEWWSKQALTEVFAAAGIPDTRTPRGGRIGDTTGSRLSRTLARHESLDSMISGKRKITSSYRTNRLGSLNSDHVTGRAYDLIGNQLGMYKTAVENNGGFAEFHGGLHDRHLHVVPGPGPMGDTTAAVKMGSYSGGDISKAPAKSITINLNVNGIGIKEAIPQIQAELQRTLYEYGNRQ